MISNVELELDSRVRKDVLHGIVIVHINVCSFSFVNGIIQQYKTGKANQNKGITQRNQ